MPYKNPDDKLRWEKENRAEEHAIFLDATKWANNQIKTLKEIGVSHTSEEWKKLFHDLAKSKLKSSTIKSLSVDLES